MPEKIEAEIRYLESDVEDCQMTLDGQIREFKAAAERYKDAYSIVTFMPQYIHRVEIVFNELKEQRQKLMMLRKLCEEE